MPEATADQPTSDEPVGADVDDSAANRTRPRRVWISVAKVFAWLILAGLAVPAVLRILWATVVVTAGLLVLRWRPPAIAAMVLSVVGLSWLVPLYVAAPDPPQNRQVNVATVNTLYGRCWMRLRSWPWLPPTTSTC